ncbi:MAG: hypothetical protein WCK67_08550 [bacterium]
MDLPEEYVKQIALGIDQTANLSDLNNMTDRGEFPLKPWTAAKTISTMSLIREFNISDEEVLLEKFQEYSKISIQVFTEQVYEHQIKYFGYYKYSKVVIFRYTYCCIIINSLKGNQTEKLFDAWAKQNGIKLSMPELILDTKYHIDRLQLNEEKKVISFISVKPNLFRKNFMQYQDVFAGLQLLTKISGISWRIYYRDGSEFRLIQLSTLESAQQKVIIEWSENYNPEEIQNITPVILKLKNENQVLI